MSKKELLILGTVLFLAYLWRKRKGAGTDPTANQAQQFRGSPEMPGDYEDA